MAITRLTLQNFRNYSELRLDASPGFNIFSGENGAGKTNILEAVSLLAPGRGLRRVALTDMALENGPGEFAVAAEVDDVQIGTGTSKAQPLRRKSRINGTSVPTNDLAERLSILWLTPAMDRLFQEGATGRRNFLDRLVTALEPAHARNCSRYDAARRERNRLLGDERAPDPAWLDGLDEQLASHGSAIAQARLRLVDLLNAVLASSDNGLFAAAELMLDGESFEGEETVRQSLLASRQADIAARRTLRGPHRTDLKVAHRTNAQAAEKCSTGEQKALLFSIVLAHADLIAKQRGSRPIMLLDEVTAHLDPKRRAALFDRLAQEGGQVWLTGTEAALFDTIPSDAKHFRVHQGNVSLR